MFLAIKANYTHAVGLGTRLMEVKLIRPFISRGFSAQTHLASFESLNHPVRRDARGGQILTLCRWARYRRAVLCRGTQGGPTCGPVYCSSPVPLEQHPGSRPTKSDLIRNDDGDGLLSSWDFRRYSTTTSFRQLCGDGLPPGSVSRRGW